MSRFFSVHGTEAAMSSKRQQKKQQRSRKLAQDMQDALADIVLSQLDMFWRKHGEGFENTPQQGQILRAIFINLHNNPDPNLEALANEVELSDLDVALERAKHARSLRVPKAREWATESLPLFLNELRNGDIGQFPNKAEFVEQFRDPVFNFDRGIISDKELEDIWTAYYRSNIHQIIGLTQQAQNRETVLEATNEYMADVISKAMTGTAFSEATNDVLGGAIRGAIDLQAEENKTVLVATTEYLADVVGGAVAGTAISEVTNDVLHGAVRLATVFEGLPRWQERARRRVLRGDMPNPYFWPEVAFTPGRQWDSTGFQTQ
jgi:hypothetical protein